ncbi:MAG: hypothetical protein ACK515_24845 [bacterium]|jgi:hypothetical protein|nr:hypothetical protein [Betaproteobacteria bacterium]
MTAEQLDCLLRTSLELWQSEATLQAVSEAPLQARLALPGNLHLTVREAGPDEGPFRWWLVWSASDADHAPAGGQAIRHKPCASTLGLLRSLRESLGVSAVSRVRIGTGAGRSMQ